VQRRSPPLWTDPRTNGTETRPVDKPHSKPQFTYDAVTDSYRCPTGAQLIASERCQGKTPSEGFIRYRTRACRGVSNANAVPPASRAAR